MKLLKAYDPIFKVLFDSNEELLLSNILSEAQLQIKERCLAIYTRKLADPLISDKTIAIEFEKHFNVTARTIYNDIRAVEELICAIKKANKEYIRFIVTENQKWAIKKEKQLIYKGKESTKDLTYASMVLAKTHNLDQIDPDTPEFGEIQPPPIDVTNDVTVMDIKDFDDVEEMKRKYLPEYRHTKDADIIN